MVQWIHTFWWKRRLKKSINDPNKLDLATKYQKTHAVMEVLGSAEEYFKKLEFLFGKIKNRLKKMQMIINSTETIEDKNKTQLEFTEYEKQHLKSQNRINKILVFLFIFAEGGFYYLTLESIMHGESFMIPRLVIAIALAIFIMYALDWSIEQHYKYDEMKSKSDDYSLNDYSLKKYKDNKKLGYVVIFFVVLVIVAAGILRIVYLESKDTSGYTPQQIERMQKTDFWQSVLTFSLTFLFGIFMGLFKRNKYAELMKYKVYKAWSITNKKLTKYIKDREDIIAKFKVQLNYILEKQWQLVLETRRFYSLEYDEKNENLYNDLKAQKSSGYLTINPELYQKFEQIQCVDEKLFKYGITEEEAVKNIFEKISKTNEKIEEERNKFENLNFQDKD